jgi:UDP-N-acetylmuramoyl-L-alanyl-D-glutamate--2,6-diaminopimelate ligase
MARGADPGGRPWNNEALLSNNSAMKLVSLLPADAVFDARSAAREVTGISADSRTVEPDNVFVALAGSKDDGLRFVGSAIKAGAAAIIAERVPATPLPPDVSFVRVADARRALALGAAKFFPRQPEVIAAVTGTSGKTSVAAFTRQIWSALGKQAASIGTIGLVSPKRQVYGSLTTPDPVALHRSLDELVGEGVTHLAMEASSHGLDQRRLDGVRVAAGAFTNLSRDHLDYHPTLESYLAAKLRLFTDLVVPGGAAVIVADHDVTETVVAAARERDLRLMMVGRRGDGIRLLDTKIEGFAQVLRVAHAGRETTIRLPLVGTFQVENALTAAGLAISTGGEPGEVFAALENLEGAKGRLDLAGERNGAPVFVDYAHKPDALAKALEALRPYVTSRLVVVFGCGGDRDPGKRPMMGEIAAQLADRVVVTDDNPRSENPAAIRAAILAAAPGAIEIGDRAEAIRASVAELHRGDVLLIAGKGHETGQIVGQQVLPFSDHEAVAAALTGRGA